MTLVAAERGKEAGAGTKPKKRSLAQSADLRLQHMRGPEPGRPPQQAQRQRPPPF